MRDERDWERALEAIAGGSSLRSAGVPKSTILSRAERDAKFARRLAAAQQTGRLHLRSAAHVVGGGELTREELIGIITEQAREGRGWACRTMLGHVIDELEDAPRIAGGRHPGRAPWRACSIFVR